MLSCTSTSSPSLSIPISSFVQAFISPRTPHLPYLSHTLGLESRIEKTRAKNINQETRDRMWLTYMSLFSIFVTIINSKPGNLPSYTIHERRAENPSWKRETHFNQNNQLKFRFGLKQTNLQHITSELERVSSPDSNIYAAHWSPEKVQDFFKPSHESQKIILEWINSVLGEEGGAKLSQGGGWVEVVMSISQANQLLKTEYGSYIHTDGHSHIGNHHLVSCFTFFFSQVRNQEMLE